MTRHLILYTTVADRETARRIGRTLVQEGPCACVNFFEVGSTYRRKGTLVEDHEVGMFLKTTVHRYKALEERLRALHPYELPAVVAFPTERGSAAYLKWIEEETRG